MALVRTLIDCDQRDPASALPEGLRELYDGDLHLDERGPGAGAARPFVMANFVSTLDGVVSYGIRGQSSGATISASNAADRFIMGLLRASADAIVVGAGTVEEVSAESLWTAEAVYPKAKRLYAEYRVRAQRESESPLLAIVSGSGRLEMDRAIFRTPAMRVVVITTSAGRDELARRGAAERGSVRVLDSDDGRIAPGAILQLLQTEFGAKRVLNEGGPRLFGQFLAAEAMDELFLTLAPQIAGRKDEGTRPALVQGTEFMPGSAPWLQVVSVKEQDGFLYLRYRRERR